MNHLSNQGGLGLGMNMPQQNIQGLHYSNMFANAGHVDYYGSMNLNGTNQQQQQQQQQRYYQANVGNASAGGNMMGGKYSQARMSMNGVGNGKKDYGKVIAN
jgi:hypothetical protein